MLTTYHRLMKAIRHARRAFSLSWRYNKGQAWWGVSASLLPIVHNETVKDLDATRDALEKACRLLIDYAYTPELKRQAMGFVESCEAWGLTLITDHVVFDRIVRPRF